MISIDRVYKTVLTYVNSDIRGNVTPAELKLAVNDSVQEIYEEYIIELNRFLNRENRGLIGGGIENMPDRIREKLQHFSTTATLTYSAPNFQLPANYRYIDGVYYNSTSRIEIMKNSREFKLVAGFSHTQPTTTNPIALQQGTNLKVLPTSITANVTIDYLRNPLLANWTYNVVSGAEIYNPSANDHQDVDLHPSEENNLIIRVAQRFGVNLKETDLQASTTSEKTQDSNNEMQS